MSEASSETPRDRVAGALGSLWWLPLIRGILLFLLGGYALFRPGMTLGALAQVVGVFVIMDGILSIVAGIMGDVPSRGWVIVRGVLEILVGAFVFTNPLIVAGVTATFLVSVLAFSAILSGVLEIVAAIQDREQIEGEGWLILGGTITLLFGVVLLISPFSFGLFMVRVLGAFAIFSGVSLIVFAFRLRGLGKKLKA
ncbi:HdeD family acid-resistance protein [Pirellulales bacterium]|nr:HdeD family acid-resistance protein [Pirellulales bacterium]